MKKLILLVIVLVLVALGVYVYLNKPQPAESISDLQLKAGLPVRVYEVARGDLMETVSVSGTIEPIQKVTVAATVMERIAELPVKAGQKVAQGDLLVRLDTDKAGFQVAQAQAKVNLTREALRRLENGTRPEEISIAKAGRAEAQALLELLKIEKNRQEKLYAEQATTLQQVQDVENRFNNAAAAVEAAQANFELAKNGPRQEDIAAARAELELSEAQLAQAEDYLADHYLKAPFAGQVGLTDFEVGDVADVNMALFKMVDVSRVYLKVDVSELYISKLEPGQSVTVTVDALKGQEFAGTIDQINPVINQKDRSYITRILIDNGGGKLRMGMFGRAHIVIDRADNALAVPADALRSDEQGDYVLAVEGGEKAVTRRLDVKPGRVFDSRVEVLSGLAGGERIVGLGKDISADMKVTVVQD